MKTNGDALEKSPRILVVTGKKRGCASAIVVDPRNPILRGVVYVCWSPSPLRNADLSSWIGFQVSS